ncbi:nucleotidyltransferase domain-containing protein [Candidatus Woesearchaeota archaeon]|nr:nucleotidyltransferase domain-containing protein [Candidatus Woesearchaeota archaeon]
MSYTKLTQELKRRLSKLPYVDAFYIHGSRGAGRHTPISDMDYTVLIKDKRYNNRLYKELEDILELENVPGFFGDALWPVHSWEGLDVGWHVIETGYLKKLVRDIFKSKENLLKFQDQAQFLIIEAKPVYDPKGLLKLFKSRLRKYPKRLADAVVEDRIKKLETKIMWIGEHGHYRNPFHFIENMHEIILFIAQAHYAKNRAFLMNSMKRWHQDMKLFKPNIKRDLDELVKIDKNIARYDKGKVLRRIIEKLK